jgi:hypothetical protein
LHPERELEAGKRVVVARGLLEGATKMNWITRLLASSLFTVALVPACAVAPSNEDDVQLSQTSQLVTTNEIMARAREWIADRVPYCGRVRGGTDFICGGTCVRPAAAWDNFRSDCSGYVSWSWRRLRDLWRRCGLA